MLIGSHSFHVDLLLPVKVTCKDSERINIKYTVLDLFVFRSIFYFPDLTKVLPLFHFWASGDQIGLIINTLKEL